jgi:alkylation response protein AidB-like acyl-CoA dehydrogenase
MNHMIPKQKNNPDSLMMSLEDVIGDYVIPNSREIDKTGEFPRENIKALSEAGFLGLIIPQELGGMGASPAVYKEVVTRLAKACASTALVFVQHISATSVMLHGRKQLYVEKWLTEITENGCLATIAFSEAGSGCYFFLPVSQASLTDDGDFLLNAKKTMVTSAGEADIYIVNTLSTTATNSRQSNFYIVKKDTDGFYDTGIWEGMGLRGNCSAPMILENCRVSQESMIGEEGEGFKIVQKSLLPMGQIGISSINIGIAKAIYEESVAYVKKRHYDHLNAGLSSIQSIQLKIAEMRILCDTAEKALEHSIKQMVEGTLDIVSTLEIKVLACETALKVAELSLKVCGGHAYSARSPLERYIRDSKAGTVMGPTPEILKELIGKYVLDIATQL